MSGSERDPARCGVGGCAQPLATKDWIKGARRRFIKMIKMVIARSSAVRWCRGHCAIQDDRKVGTVGVSLGHFELVSSFA